MSAIDRGAPGKLWSLLDLMRQFPFGRLHDALLRAASYSIARNDEAVKTAKVNAVRRIELFNHLLDVVACAQAAGLKETPEMAKSLKGSFDADPNLSTMEAFTSVTNLTELMVSELSKTKVFVIYEAEAKMFEQEAFFGGAVFDAYPSARMDIAEAGSCFACGRYNAAIYHAVQAAEFGLRALARDRRVVVRMHKKDVPLDQAMWGKIIEGLAPKISLIDSWSAGSPKDAAHQFFKPSLLDADTLNDAFRRHISHGRGYRYEKADARFVLDVSQRFLNRLSRHCGENDKLTPAVWTRVPKPIRS